MRHLNPTLGWRCHRTGFLRKPFDRLMGPRQAFAVTCLSLPCSHSPSPPQAGQVVEHRVCSQGPSSRVALLPSGPWPWCRTCIAAGPSAPLSPPLGNSSCYSCLQPSTVSPSAYPTAQAACSGTARHAGGQVHHRPTRTAASSALRIG